MHIVKETALSVTRHGSRRGAGWMELDAIKRTIWLLRPDVRAFCHDDPDQFECWLLCHGVGEYAALSDAHYVVPAALSEPAADSAATVRPAMSRLMRLLWEMRPDLRAAFPLDCAVGQQEFVWWFLITQVPDLGFNRTMTAEQLAILNEPEPGIEDAGPVPVTRLMAAIWRRRPDLQQAFPLALPEGRAGFLAWYFTIGLMECRLLETLDTQQGRGLLQVPLGTTGAPPLLQMIWAGDAALRARFPDAGMPELRVWARQEGAVQYPVLQRLLSLGDIPHAVSRLSRPAARPFGVNLIGHARGQFGVGEDVRMAALALRAQGIPFTIHNAAPGPEVCQDDDSVDGLIGDGLPYAVNMLCVTGIETARLAALKGNNLLDGRPTIGCWPWELPAWPREWQHAYALVDEVWAASRYSYAAYAADESRPVRHMTMAVTADATAGMNRSDFGLPEDRFLFIFSFDFLSGLERKNPMACLQAFAQAFPLGGEPVGLVIKGMRGRPSDPAWQAIGQAATADPRIRIIDGTLGRAAVLDLYRACDAFVSLHRAEGFGRGIAEAMLLGLPVIVTGHSGNMDFTTPGTAALVDHRLCPVAPGAYPFADGQSWAEPDIGHAAWWMRRLVMDPTLRQRLSRQGQALVASTYAPTTVGAGYAAILAQLGR